MTRDPSRIWGVLGSIVAAVVLSCWAASVEKAASRARKLEKRVVALEQFRTAATAAGVEQERLLREIQGPGTPSFEGRKL